MFSIKVSRSDLVKLYQYREKGVLMNTMSTGPLAQDQ